MAAVAEQTLEERVAKAMDAWAPREWSPSWRPMLVPMSFEEYLEADALPGQFEWVDGFATEKPMPDLPHMFLHSWLVTLLFMFAQRRGIGDVFTEGLVMKADDEGNGRRPDILFVRKGRQGEFVNNQYLGGPADLVVEVTSPGTARVDRGAKFREYSAAGVGEYWMLDPRLRRTTYFNHDGNRLAPAATDADGVFYSVAMPGVFIDPRWLWDMPAVDDVLAKWDAAAGPI